jgi:hypothetical protein
MTKEEVPIEIKKELLNESEISLVLDTYDDIFSDFDPRHFNTRALSEDFLLEAKRACLDKPDGLELRFLIPRAHRNVAHEALIKQRLREHFTKHNLMILEKIRIYKKQAMILIISGVLLGFAAIGVTLLNINQVIKNALEIILQPASWFTIWTGFEHLTFMPEKLTSESEFYRKMTSAHVFFTPY